MRLIYLHQDDFVPPALGTTSSVFQAIIQNPIRDIVTYFTQGDEVPGVSFFPDEDYLFSYMSLPMFALAPQLNPYLWQDDFAGYLTVTASLVSAHEYLLNVAPIPISRMAGISNTENSGSTWTNFPAGGSIAVTRKAVIVVLVRHGTNNSAVTTITDTEGNTFNLITSVAISASELLSAFYATNLVATTSTMTAHFSTPCAFVSLIAIPYLGLNYNAPLDTSVVTSTSGTSSITSPTFSTAQVNELIVLLSGKTQGSGGTVTVPVNYKKEIDVNTFGGDGVIANQIVGPIQTNITAAESGPTTNWGLIVVTFKGANPSAFYRHVQESLDSTQFQTYLTTEESRGGVLQTRLAPEESLLHIVPTQILFVNSVTNQDFSATTYTDFDTGSSMAIKAGNFIYVKVKHGTNNTTVPTVSDANGNTFTFLTQIILSSTELMTCYYAKNITGTSSKPSAHFSTSVARVVISAAQYSGVDTVAPLVPGFGTASPPSVTVINATPVSTITPDALIIAAVETTAVQTVTPTAPFVTDAIGATAAGIIARYIPTSLQTGLQFQASGVLCGWACLVAVFKPATPPPNTWSNQESRAGVLQGRIIPECSTLGILQTKLTPEESRSGGIVTSPRITPEESIAFISQTRITRFAWRLGVLKSLVEQQESRLNLIKALIETEESRSTVSQSRITPEESRLGVLRALAEPFAFRSGIKQTRLTPEEAYGSIFQTRLTPEAALLHVLSFSGGQLASDNFTRADANPISGNWTIPTFNDNNVEIISNTAAGAAGGYCAAYYTGVVWPNDQWAETTVGNNNGTIENLQGPVVRANSNGDMYIGFYEDKAGHGGSNLLFIKKHSATFGTVDLTSRVLTTVNPGDVIRLSVVGSLLTLYLNGVSQMSVSDSDITSGSAGIGFFTQSGPSDCTVTLWAGGVFGNVHAQESRLGVLQTKITPEGSRGGILQTRLTPEESRVGGLITNPRITPQESRLGVLKTLVETEESRLGVLRTLVEQQESRGYIAQTTLIPEMSLGRLPRALVTPEMSLAYLIRASLTAEMSLAPLQQMATEGEESRLGVKQTKAEQEESRGGISQSRLSPEASLGKMFQVLVTAEMSLQAINRSLAEAEESLATRITAAKVTPEEFRSTINQTKTEAQESRSSVTNTRITPENSLGHIARILTSAEMSLQLLNKTVLDNEESLATRLPQTKVTPQNSLANIKNTLASCEASLLGTQKALVEAQESRGGINQSKLSQEMSLGYLARSLSESQMSLGKLIKVLVGAEESLATKVIGTRVTPQNSWLGVLRALAENQMSLQNLHPPRVTPFEIINTATVTGMRVSQQASLGVITKTSQSTEMSLAKLVHALTEAEESLLSVIRPKISIQESRGHIAGTKISAEEFIGKISQIRVAIEESLNRAAKAVDTAEMSLSLLHATLLSQEESTVARVVQARISQQEAKSVILSSRIEQQNSLARAVKAIAFAEESAAAVAHAVVLNQASIGLLVALKVSTQESRHRISSAFGKAQESLQLLSQSKMEVEESRLRISLARILQEESKGFVFGSKITPEESRAIIGVVQTHLHPAESLGRVVSSLTSVEMSLAKLAVAGIEFEESLHHLSQVVTASEESMHNPAVVSQRNTPMEAYGRVIKAAKSIEESSGPIKNQLRSIEESLGHVTRSNPEVQEMLRHIIALAQSLDEVGRGVVVGIAQTPFEIRGAVAFKLIAQAFSSSVVLQVLTANAVSMLSVLSFIVSELYDTSIVNLNLQYQLQAQGFTITPKLAVTSFEGS